MRWDERRRAKGRQVPCVCVHVARMHAHSTQPNPSTLAPNQPTRIIPTLPTIKPQHGLLLAAKSNPNTLIPGTIRVRSRGCQQLFSHLLGRTVNGVSHAEERGVGAHRAVVLVQTQYRTSPRQTVAAYATVARGQIAATCTLAVPQEPGRCIREMV